MSTASKAIEVIIIGGGLGGLCLAQGLKKANITVNLYERDRTRTERLQGYRLYVNPRGSRALYNCLPDHLYEAFDATCGKPGKTVRILSEKLEELLFINRKAELADPVDSHRSVSRITLRELLLSGLEDIVHFNKTFTHFEQVGDKVTAFFDDGTSVTGDVLIGADGGNSRVRKQLVPDAQRVDTGIRVIAGKVPLAITNQLPIQLVDGVASVMTPRGCGMFIARQEFQHHLNEFESFAMPAETEHSGLLFDNKESYVMWALCVKKEALDSVSSEPESLLGVAKKTCGNWHSAFQQLIDSSEPSTVGEWKIQTSVPVEHWQTSRVTLLGDAIHSMPPMGGTGSSIALQDAEHLCQSLLAVQNGERELIPALYEYEVEMLDYGFKAVQNSMMASRQFIEDSAWSPLLVSTMLKILNLFPVLKQSFFKNLG